ncbi:MAG: hypothetical protein H6658_07195 [Ardenticatenaceae bacterium]|nr:hypothetical protein [Ardenticatenaceae bacterium]
MSPYHEFEDLEEALRRKRPFTDPFPLAAKNRLRSQLLEEAAMAQQRLGLSISRAATLLGGLAVIVVIPLLFWFTLSSQNRPDGFAPLTAPDNASRETAPMETAVDTAAVINIGQAQAAGNGMIEALVTVAYSLVSTDEATLFLTYTFPDEGGTFYGERLLPVTQGDAEVVFTVDMPATAVQANGSLHDAVAFAIELVIGTVPDSGDTDNYAVIAAVGTAVAHPNNPELMDLPVQIDYKLTDYDEAVVIVGYLDGADSATLAAQPVPELVDVIVDNDGNVLSTQRYHVDESGNRIPVQGEDEATRLSITQGASNLNATVVVPVELVDEDGALLEGVELWVALELAETAE